MFNETTLFAYLRRAPFGGRLTQAQVEGVRAILKAWKSSSETNLRWLAYILATAFHETGGRMVPVREGFATTDAKARKIVAHRGYGKPDKKTGHVYYGRGPVQITWATNYKRIGERFGVDLLNNPDRALELELGSHILVVGMIEGLFTGKKLATYFGPKSKDNPTGARRIVNGLDKAELIASYYTQIYAALQAAETSTPQPADVVASEAKPDAPALTTDKTVLGSVVSTIGAGGAGVFAGIDNPWAFAAVVVAILVGALGAWLFFTRRLEIRRKAGA